MGTISSGESGEFKPCGRAALARRADGRRAPRCRMLRRRVDFAGDHSNPGDMLTFNFDTAFVRDLPGDPESGPRLRQVAALWSSVEPTPVGAPRLLAHSAEMAARLDLTEADVASPGFAEVFAGNTLLPGMRTVDAHHW